MPEMLSLQEKLGIVAMLSATSITAILLWVPTALPLIVVLTIVIIAVVGFVFVIITTIIVIIVICLRSSHGAPIHHKHGRRCGGRRQRGAQRRNVRRYRRCGAGRPRFLVGRASCSSRPGW